MSYQVDHWVRCDKCGDLGCASPTRTLAQSEAKRAGWKKVKGKDYCPFCVEQGHHKAVSSR